MEERKFLNEEQFQKNRKRLNRIAIAILIVGVIIGIGIFIFGKISDGSARTTETIEAEIKIEEERLRTVLAQVKESVKPITDEINANQFNFSKQIELKDSISEEMSLIKEVENYFKGIPALRKTETTKAQSLRDELTLLEMRYRTGFSSSKNIGRIGAIAVVFMLSVGLSGMIFLLANRRSLLAYGAQSSVPVAKEVIEEVSPSIGKVAKEVTKGVKEGLNEEANKEEIESKE